MDYQDKIILRGKVEVSSIDSVFRAIYNSGHTLMMFNALENDLIEFLKFIPLEYYKESNERELIYSPRLANILMNIGSQIDSFFRYWQKVHKKWMNDNHKVITEENIKYLHFGDYKKIEQSDFSLNKEIYILSIDKCIKPFEIVESDNNEPKVSISWEKWKHGKENENKSWWSAYNHIKHNGYYAIKEGNLDNVLKSLGAFFNRDDRSYDPFRGWRSQLFYFEN